jgi:N-acyl homoserine lactone hydrolase
MADSSTKLFMIQLFTTEIKLPNGQTQEMVLPCYLIQTQSGRHILIDTGYPADVVPPQGMPVLRGRTNVIEELAKLGFEPKDIDTVICTHFDVDHAGYHDAFTHAGLIVQREHYDVARGGNPRFAKARNHWDHPGLRYRLIDGDTELLPGLLLLETSGHVPGHQSVLVRLPQTGAVLLAIDAVMFQRSFVADRKAAPNDDDEEKLRASTRKLLDLVEQERVVLTVFGHDGAQWKTLRKAPEFYE